MKKPNVILMFVDDLGYGDVECFNENSQIHTPSINALADRGLRFTDSHATSALCTPSRYGLLTGRYNWRSKLKKGVLFGDASPIIEEGRMTIADLFRQNGYHTSCVGKWHLGLEWERNEDIYGKAFGAEDEVKEGLERYKKIDPPLYFKWNGFRYMDALNIDYSKPIKNGPCDYGFDYFFGLPASLDQPPYVYIENDRVLEKPAYVSGELILDRSSPKMQQKWQRGPIAPGYDHKKVLPDMTDKVLELIDTHKSEPFFIYFPTPAVHGPLLPTAEFDGKSGLGPYGDVVLMVDDMVGQITEKLKENGIWEDTIFIFTSDNGCSKLADIPTLLSLNHNPSYIFRGYKAEIYEGGHRVPTIVSWPGKYHAPGTCSQTVCHSDFFRTFAELFKTPLPDNAAEDSISNLPLWNGENQAVRRSIVHSSGDGSFSIRRGPWKLELCRGDGGFLTGRVFDPSTSDEHPFQLYNMDDDVRERTNRASQMPELVQELKSELLDCIYRGRSTPGEIQENTGGNYWEELASFV